MDLLRVVGELDYSNIVMSKMTMILSDWIQPKARDSDHVFRLDSTHMMIARGHDQDIEPFKCSTMLEYVKNRYSHDTAQIMSLPDQGLDQSK